MQLYFLPRQIDFQMIKTTLFSVVGIFLLGFSAAGQSSDCYADPCELPPQSMVLSSDFGLWYNLNEPIMGLQLDYSGSLVSVGGGILEALEFYETFGTTTYVAFSMTADVVPSGCGVLTYFAVESSEFNLSDLIVSDASAAPISIDLLNGGEPFACVVGCTDPEACNYAPEATLDDGSCAAEDVCGECGGDNTSCTGCTNENATNFNPSATIEDGSCLYNQEAVNAIIASLECPPCTDSECPGDLTADGAVNVDDILSILSLFGLVCTE